MDEDNVIHVDFRYEDGDDLLDLAWNMINEDDEIKYDMMVNLKDAMTVNRNRRWNDR